MHKSCDVQIKAAGADDGLLDGQFRAIVSVFGNKDSYGDVILPDAFDETLAEWKASGDPIPVYWSHQMSDPDMNIGYVIDAKATDVGLEVLAQLDVEDGSPKAQQVYKLLKGRRVKQFSFAYDVLDGGAVEKDGDSFYELRKLKLYEVGPTPVGANSETELLAVKRAALSAQSVADDVLDGLKVGRVLSAKHESTLREALDALDASAAQIKSVLSAVAPSDDDSKAGTTRTSKASDADSIKHREDDGSPVVGQCEESARKSTVELWEIDLSLTELEGASL